MTSESLIPRPIFFGNPDIASVKISPGGDKVAFLSSWEGVLNVHVRALESSGAEAVCVSQVKDRPILSYRWAYNGNILFAKDKGGDENYHIFSVDVSNPGEARDMTPGDKVKASISKMSPDRPDEILIEWNARDESQMDVGRLNLRDGSLSIVFENTNSYTSMVPDEDWTVRVRTKMTEDGGSIIEYRGGDGADWSEFGVVAPEDLLTTDVVGFNKYGDVLYMQNSVGADKAFLEAVALDKGFTKTTKTKTVFESKEADVSDVEIHPSTRVIESCEVNSLRKVHHVLDESVRQDYEGVSKLVDGDWSLTARSLDDSRWTVEFVKDDGPVEYWLWDRTSQTGTFLFHSRKELATYSLAKMHALYVAARDSLQLPTYLTLPRGIDKESKPELPTVLLVHGGPWARDTWGYNPLHQWLSNRGYAVASVNYRSSTGFGKSFGNLGNLQWYKTMQDDLNDVREWLVQQGISDTKRIAIMGGSYGGYATLAGLTRDPELWACGVDIVGPSHITTLLNSIPPYWAPMKALFKAKVGDLEDTAFMDSISPLTFVENITKPLIIGQGANDPRVKVHESDQIVEVMVKKSIPVTYVVFPDEGHGFARPENKLAFYGVTEAFLQKHIGGGLEPLGDVLEPSSAEIRQAGGLSF
jgi:dipeptidyl aminopeptidase/acylaminoacyl peptidase